MTCHNFLRPIRGDFTSSSYTTENKTCSKFTIVQIKLCSFISLISQKFSDLKLAIAESKRSTQDFPVGITRLEYWIFVYPFGHSTKSFSKTTFSLNLWTLGCHFRLTSSLPRNFQFSEKVWKKTPLPFRLVSFVDWKISKHVLDLIFLHNNFIRNVFFVF